MENRGATGLWRPQFRRYLIARGLSVGAGSLSSVVLAFAILQAGGDSFWVGLTLAAGVVAQSITLPLGGVLADRLSRKHIILVSNALTFTALLTTGTMLTLTPQGLSPAFFVFGAILTGASSAISLPALQGFIVDLVPKESLQEANAIQRLVINSCRTVVPALGPLVGQQFGYGPVLLTASLTIVFAAVVIATVRHSKPPQLIAESMWRQARQGWSFFVGTKWLWLMVLMGSLAIPLWLAGYQLLGPLVSQQRHDGALAWGFGIAAFAVGLIAGGLIAIRWRPRRLLFASVCVQFLWPVPLAVLALEVNSWLIVPALFLSGVVLDISIVFWETVKQQNVPSELIGRVSSVGQLGELVFVPLAYLVAGGFTNWLGTGPVLLICVLGITLTNLVLVLSKVIRAMGAPSTGP